MKKSRFYFSLFAVLSLILLSFRSDKIKLIRTINVPVKEPSGIAYYPKEDVYFVVSDNGKLFKLNKNFKKVKKAEHTGIDFEDVCLAKDLVVVTDETARKILFYDTDLNLVKIKNISYSGGRNKGIESITFNKKTNQFMLVTEKEPIYVFAYNDDLLEQNNIEINLAGDISSLTFYKGNYYFLSDDDRSLIKTDLNFNKLTEWKLPIVNPEGLTFNNNELVVVSDDLQKAYFFDLSTLE